MGKKIGSPPGPRPHLWVHPHDKYHNDKHRTYSKAKAQADYRNEEWSLTAAEWDIIWPDHLWDRRGRDPESLCMSRKDYEKGWSLDNVRLLTRRAHLVYLKRTFAELAEIEQGVFDLTGQSLLEYKHRKTILDKYKGRYPKKGKTNVSN